MQSSPPPHSVELLSPRSQMTPNCPTSWHSPADASLADFWRDARRGPLGASCSSVPSVSSGMPAFSSSSPFSRSRGFLLPRHSARASCVSSQSFNCRLETDGSQTSVSRQPDDPEAGRRQAHSKTFVCGNKRSYGVFSTMGSIRASASACPTVFRFNTNRTNLLLWLILLL